MDNFFKLVFITFFFLSSNCYAGYDLDSRFLARNLAALRKAELSTMLAATASVQYEAITTSGSKVFAAKAVPVSKKAFGAIAKRVALGPWGASILTAFSLADLVFDSSTGEVASVSGSSSTILGSCACVGVAGYGTNTYSWCMQAGNVAACTTELSFDPLDTSLPTEFYSGYPSIDYQVGSTLTDEEVSDVLTPNMSESFMKDLLRDPLTGLPNSNVSDTPQPVDASTPDTDPFTATADSLTAEYNTSIQNDITVNPTTTTINDSYTNIANATPVIELEIADPCDDNPDRVGCSIMGDLTSVNIPIETPSFDYQPILLSGSASCPSPTTVNTTFGSVSMSNQPLCDFATGISPVVITLCSFLSIYLLVGGVRNG